MVRIATYPTTTLPELVEQAAREELSPLAFLDLLLTGQVWWDPPAH